MKRPAAAMLEADPQIVCSSPDCKRPSANNFLTLLRATGGLPVGARVCVETKSKKGGQWTQARRRTDGGFVHSWFRKRIFPDSLPKEKDRV